MNPERWGQVTKIFDAALDQPASEQKEFVRRECNGDEELAAEVFKLLAADERAHSFLEEAATIVSRGLLSRTDFLSPGVVVCGRFEVLRFIGQGGMGQVYEALDLELKSHIALKVIRPEISSDSRALSRFRREVQITRRITHPNVCRTFDIAHHSSTADGAAGSDISLLTMELLDGETLDALLRRQGRLTSMESLPLVLQMIEALDAAHVAGIIHRDFKPSNILLVPASANSNSGLRVVVTDFGLAHALVQEGQIRTEQASSLTGDQAVMGTLVYMAPEQFERGETSVASDIYSLGLVMFEMVTGRRPFRDDIAMAEATKRLKQPAPLASTLVSDFDPAWDAAIARCLALDAKNRFQTVQQVREAVIISTRPGSDVRVSDSIPKSNAATQAKLEPVRRSKVLAIALIVAMLASLFVFGFRHYLWRLTPIAFAERDWILVTDFNNQTGERLFDRVVRDLAVESLSQSSYLNIVARFSVLEAAKRAGLKDVTSIDEKLGRDLCIRENYKALLSGSISRSGSRYTIAMRVETPGKDAASLFYSETIQSPDELYTAVDRLTARVRRGLGESLSTIETATRPLAQVTTNSLEALQRYSAAVDLYGQREFARCNSLASDAIDRDPSFAMAHLLLARSYEQLGDTPSSDKEMAAAQANANHSSERERHLIQAVWYSSRLMHDRALDEYQHILDIFPDDVLALKGIGYEAYWSGYPDRSISALRQAVALVPHDSEAYDSLMTMLVRASRFSEAVSLYAELHQRGMNSASLTFSAAIADWGLGDLDKAKLEFESLDNGSSVYWKLVRRLYTGKLFAFRGRMKEAINSFHDGFVLVQSRELQQWQPVFAYQIARAVLVSGDASQAKTECKSFANIARKVNLIGVYQRSVRVCAQAHELNTAEQLTQLARKASTSSTDEFSMMRLDSLDADIYMAEGHLTEAITKQQDALALRKWYIPYLSLGDACMATHNWRCAVDAYRGYVGFEGEILREDTPEDWSLAHFWLAKSLYAAGDVVAARAELKEFLDLFATSDSNGTLDEAKRYEAMWNTNKN